MALRDLVPSQWGSRKVPVSIASRDPILSFQRQMNRLFDDFFTGSGFAPFGQLDDQLRTFTPQIDIQEDEKEVVVTAELPGMDEKDVEISLSNDTLVLRGEKKEERKSNGKEKEHRYIERSYGMFERVIPLTTEIDENNIDASYRNGILTITLPKTEQAQQKAKKIPVKAK